MTITKSTKFAIDQDVEIVINSANGLLNPDTGGAGAIREASEDLDDSERRDLDELFTQAPKEIQEFIEWKKKQHGWHYHHENLSCLKLLAVNEYKPYEVGTAIFDPLWSEKSDKKVIHAITVSYNPKEKKRIIADETQVKSAMKEAFEIAAEFSAKSIAIPIPVARPGYGLDPKTSEQIMLDLAAEFEKNFDIVLCYDNEHTAKLFSKAL